MTPRRAALAALLLLATFSLYFLNRNSGPTSSPAGMPANGTANGNRPGTAGPGQTAKSAAAAGNSPASAAGTPFNPADFPIAARLNAADSTIQRDLEILDQVFEAWRTNFPRDGNPIGENRDITLALTGTNRINFALIPAKHPSINTTGELCDRWGTPFRFHQLSGEQMEIRSAGPDRRFATPDDAVWTPGSGNAQNSP
jgi:hypothetical protein